MCEFSGKLIAWMDRELPESEAADVERHLGACAECRERLAAYKQVSGDIRCVLRGDVGRRSAAPQSAPAGRPLSRRGESRQLPRLPCCCCCHASA